MAKEKENPNHRMGKTTGYDLINGDYHIAPLYQERFAQIALKRQGIREMLDIVTEHAAKDLELLGEETQKLWQELAEDIGIKINGGWIYTDGIVSKKESGVK